MASEKYASQTVVCATHRLLPLTPRRNITPVFREISLELSERCRSSITDRSHATS